MKKQLLLLLLLWPIVGNAGEPDEIPLREDSLYPELHRNETAHTNFTAELLSNGSIKVLSSKITTFTVKICNASTGAILYQGSTVEGVLHITTHFWQAGRYVLQIETADASYSGEFDI